MHRTANNILAPKFKSGLKTCVYIGSACQNGYCQPLNASSENSIIYRNLRHYDSLCDSSYITPRPTLTTKAPHQEVRRRNCDFGCSARNAHNLRLSPNVSPSNTRLVDIRFPSRRWFWTLCCYFGSYIVCLSSSRLRWYTIFDVLTQPSAKHVRGSDTRVAFDFDVTLKNGDATNQHCHDRRRQPSSASAGHFCLDAASPR